MAEEKKVPRHIGFIMDGNGRWAKLRGKSRSYGHKKGADVIEEVVSACFFEGVEAVSLYAFSTENWSRPKEEIDTIFDLLEKFLRRYENKLVNERIRLIISGDLSEISEKLRNRSISVMKNTERFVGKTLNIAINYGGRDEIVHAVKKIVSEGAAAEEITEQLISDNLYTAGMPDPDFIIRPSGEYRTSNYLLWQSAYSEYWFSDILWPDFTPKKLERAIDDYCGRNRRFGGI